MNYDVKVAFRDWFKKPGAYALVDGQYGSTGKGLIAGAIAECFWEKVDYAVTNNGPNAGHTTYVGDKKIVLKQLPTFSVVAREISEYDDKITTYLSAGAIINQDILNNEIIYHSIERIQIHPVAAIIDGASIREDVSTERRIASTGQGVGPALERKIRRVSSAVWAGAPLQNIWRLDYTNKVCFVEIPQGFSLGINSGFYPHVTSRECSVSQALADAQLPPSSHRKTVMSVRTYPIRVGNTESSSGPCYPDQKELTWQELGQEPEMTTVTGRIRRVFTWSKQQYIDSLLVLDPDVIFLNFVNYLEPEDVDQFVMNEIFMPYCRILKRTPEAILLGYGPRSSDIKRWERMI